MTRPFKTVLTNGCYDIVHAAHLKLIKHARSLGDVLIVAIDSDRRISERKGTERPINNALNRGQFLEQIKGVALVVEFDTDDELRSWITELQVDILVVGAEYKDKCVVGSELVKEVVFFEKVGNYSTTEILKQTDY